MNNIMKLKYAIYDGFKLNMATYDESKNKYIYRGLEIDVPNCSRRRIALC